MTAISIGLAARAIAQGYRAAEGSGDFRGYVFAAYGAVLLLLFLFSAWTAVQTASAARKLAALERRLGLEERSQQGRCP
jgi:hypothetical protein